MQIPVEVPTEQATRKPLISRLYVIIGVVVTLVLVGLFIWAILWLARTQGPSVEVVRDIFIIALALESCLFGIILMLLLIMVIRLVNMLEFEIKPILEKTNETVAMIRGTTLFVSQNVVKPVTTASSYVAGVRRGLVTLFGNPRRNLPD
jgi:hypothetical protein